MSSSSTASCPACGKVFAGLRGLRAHASTPSADRACVYKSRSEIARISEEKYWQRQGVDPRTPWSMRPSKRARRM